MAIKNCNCKNDFQDARYGKNMRIHNVCGGGNVKGGNKGLRCTVCGDKKDFAKPK